MPSCYSKITICYWILTFSVHKINVLLNLMLSAKIVGLKSFHVFCTQSWQLLYCTLCINCIHCDSTLTVLSCWRSIGTWPWINAQNTSWAACVCSDPTGSYRVLPTHIVCIHQLFGHYLLFSICWHAVIKYWFLKIWWKSMAAICVFFFHIKFFSEKTIE